MDHAETTAPSPAPHGVNGVKGESSPVIKNEMDDTPAFKDIDWSAQELEDEENMRAMFSNMGDPNGLGSGLSHVHGFDTKEIDQAEKADDAIDFEDMDDDDLASEGGLSNNAAAGVDASQPPGLTEDEGTSHDTDHMEDLFGNVEGDPEFPPSSPPHDEVAPAPPVQHPEPDVVQDVAQDVVLEQPTAPQEISDEAWAKMSHQERWQLNFPQKELSIDKWINQTNTEGLEAQQKTPENIEELLEQRFPGFQAHSILYFNRLLPEWPAEYMYKEPPHKDRDPPEFVPTKLELDLDADHSKLFRIPENALNAAQQRAKHSEADEWHHPGGGAPLVMDDGLSDSEDEEPVGGYTLDEIATICDDWNALIDAADRTKSSGSVGDADGDAEMDDWDKEFLPSQTVPQKRPRIELGLPDISSFSSRGIDDFEGTTRHCSQRIHLASNDPYLLVDGPESERPTKRPKLEEKTKRMANGQLRRDVLQHFNVSNDDAYEALKLNHKNKVRATLSSLGVEHSMPAAKLTFPFYRTKFLGQPWEFHRPKLEVEKIIKHNIGIRKPTKVKRKDTKGKSAPEIFKTTKDLSMNDNSTAVLFEYSEQFPVMLSNFGMGNRVVNYYRRKDRNDDEKIPKLEVGETHSLLPEDRSPFSIFGTVEPGETVPTLHNEMYRAPIFKHEPRPRDFLLGHTTNQSEGPKWFLRNIDHVFVVGQTFPSLEVPGPHARKVTNTAKNRLKMIAYRMMRKKETQDVSLKEITPHVFDKEDPQNRQKMKEFLSYERERKTWRLRPGESLMDEPAIRSMIKPEDVCLIEAMQVGQRLMENAGYDPKEKEENEDGVDEPLVAQLAPWRISKNFLDASQGKAMVALHGEGDPTGHGLGFSFIKTSMKGGYINAVQGPLATSADAIERERKANGGHSYNVKKQQDMYNAAIRQIWERQQATLSDGRTHDDADVLDTANEDDRFNDRQPDATPAAVDDGRSQFSRLSMASRGGKRKLRIVRRRRSATTGEILTEHVTLDDPVLIRTYMKQRKELDDARRDVYSLQPGVDADDNREKQKLVEKELQRLLKNQDRRQIREKQGKGKKKSVVLPDASPDPSSADKAAAGTTRKCANCGQVGHIKTNKSKCPLLNGTMKTHNAAADHGGFGSFSAPSAATPNVE
ncbi:hypothetical protein F4780DRAFT_346442 [Xylariomycetidae sp. FL0641]|nr:hypothetical protein F4780DRAFT_346442 [Xylariomycetidae sp. FL0641]